MAGVTLHEEILAILLDKGGGWMSTRQLAEEINRRGIYQKRDGSPISAYQIHGRTRNYADLFEQSGSQVRARALGERPARSASDHTRVQLDVAQPIAPVAFAPSSARIALEAGRALPIDSAEVPNRPGLYAIHGAAGVWRQLGLGDPPDDRPLYVGKAEDSLASRDLRTHFETGKTGSSTLRRSVAALLASELGLEARPRNPEKPGYFSNYGIEPAGDARLTGWMRANLALATWAAPPGGSLHEVERSVISVFKPPLNLVGVTTPWSAMVSSARGLLAQRARSWTRP
jgi:hypothetical protein